MKRILLIFILLVIAMILNPFALAEENIYNNIPSDSKVYYIPSKSYWTFEDNEYDDKITLEKKLINGGSCSYSVYYNTDGTIAFALATDYEIIKDNELIIIDNNLLKFYKLIFKENNFEQTLLREEEVAKIFPERELFKISYFDDDNKVWLHKPFKKDKKILLLNDTDKSFYALSTKSKKVQNENIRSFLTFKHYGIYRFNHLGEYKGKMIFYIR